MPPNLQETTAAGSTVPALVDAFASGRQQMLDQLARIVRALVEAFTGWYSPTEVGALVDALVPQVEAAQTQVAALTNAYLAEITSTLTGRTIAPVASAPDPSLLRVGVTHAQVYERIPASYRYLRSTGTSDTAAARQVLDRAQVMADTDVALAMRDQAHLFMVGNADVVSGFRRVIHPELSKYGTCGLCIVASDRVYRTDQLLPLHARCACTVAPIVGAHDPGHRLNQGDLAAIYNAAGSNAAADLKATRVTVKHSGELGPVLVRSGDAFRDPADVEADTGDHMAPAAA